MIDSSVVPGHDDSSSLSTDSTAKIINVLSAPSLEPSPKSRGAIVITNGQPFPLKSVLRSNVNLTDAML